MADMRTKRPPGRYRLQGEHDYAEHPGVLLGEELEARALTRAALARELSVRASVVGEIVRGRRAITPDIAVGLEAALGASARFWLNLQTTYDLVESRRRRLDRSA